MHAALGDVAEEAKHSHSPAWLVVLCTSCCFHRLCLITRLLQSIYHRHDATYQSRTSIHSKCTLEMYTLIEVFPFMDVLCKRQTWGSARPPPPTRLLDETTMHSKYFEKKKSENLYLLVQKWIFFRSARGHLYYSAFPNILRENIVENPEGEEGDTVGVLRQLSGPEPCGCGARSWRPLPCEDQRVARHRHRRHSSPSTW
jgi:hypothetical protein